MKTTIFAITLILFSSFLKAQNDSISSAGKEEMVLDLRTNEDYIRNIKSELDFGNTLNVFAFVFNSLNPEVKVYPTENYYYYQFETTGKTIKGNIALFADKRDEGKINFAYEEINNLPVDIGDIKEGVIELDIRNGVRVSKINEFEYDVLYKNKLVKFLLNRLDISIPKNLRLSKNEIYIGPCYDESGVKFDLVFNERFKNFIWILNDNDKITESFANVIDNVIVGKRTEFVFYQDFELDRRVLFAVKHKNVNENNWFDGPFDQLPDNYIKSGEIEIKKYIEEAYPFYKGRINKYGHFLDEIDSRVAISTYLTYNTYIDVLKVYYACKNSSVDEEEFIYNLTKERYFDTDEN